MLREPSAEIVRAEGARCRPECVLARSGATLCGDRACRVREMQVRVRFGLVALQFWRKSRTKRSFWRLGASLLKKSRTKRSVWRLGASLLEEVSYETLVLEAWRFTFGGSLVRNARFGDLALHFWRKSRTTRRRSTSPAGLKN